MNGDFIVLGRTTADGKQSRWIAYAAHPDDQVAREIASILEADPGTQAMVIPKQSLPAQFEPTDATLILGDLEHPTDDDARRAEALTTQAAQRLRSR